MIVISDTTPLISLLKIGRLNILEILFGSVQIPKAVFAELTPALCAVIKGMKADCSHLMRTTTPMLCVLRRGC